MRPLMKPGRASSIMQNIQEELNRILEDTFGESALLDSKEPVEEMIRPAIEMSDQEGNYIIRAELPGVNKENIDIEVTEDSITIKAENKFKEEERKENLYRSELRYGKFLRTIPFPSEVKSEEAKAEYKDGILKIVVPKIEPEKTKLKKLEIE